MDSINLNSILSRENIISQINKFLINFEKNKYDLTTKRGVYLYGPPGTGKTYFVKEILTSLGYSEEGLFSFHILYINSNLVSTDSN